MGYSDITVLNVALWKETGLVTFNGPALLTDFAEHPEMLAYTRDGFRRAVCDPAPLGRITPSLDWTEETLDWRTKQDLERPRALTRSAGWTWLKDGVGEGILMDYENMGVFDGLRGMLVGRPMRYSEEEKALLREIVLERTRRHRFPIVSDMDFGHTSPQLTLPIGCRARIDASDACFEILEGAVC